MSNFEFTERCLHRETYCIPFGSGGRRGRGRGERWKFRSGKRSRRSFFFFPRIHHGERGWVGGVGLEVERLIACTSLNLHSLSTLLASFTGKRSLKPAFGLQPVFFFKTLWLHSHLIWTGPIFPVHTSYGVSDARVDEYYYHGRKYCWFSWFSAVISRI